MDCLCHSVCDAYGIRSINVCSAYRVRYDTESHSSHFSLFSQDTALFLALQRKRTQQVLSPSITPNRAWHKSSRLLPSCHVSGLTGNFSSHARQVSRALRSWSRCKHPVVARASGEHKSILKACGHGLPSNFPEHARTRDGGMKTLKYLSQ